jgi:hypothetical protein
MSIRTAMPGWENDYGSTALSPRPLVQDVGRVTLKRLFGRDVTG